MAINITITMALMGAMTDGTEVRVTRRSEARCFMSCWEIADNANNSTTNQSAMLITISLAKSHTRMPKFQKVINKWGEVVV